ncbi:MAG: amino acid-binding ACT protein [Kiritimatiellae bacterium]|jgi:glycine cleavage system regulatory protein|nr:amino acid-binding ACT protein [Kiritimatiellia bacterium]
MCPLVLTVLGPDRPGIVEAVADLVRLHNGNWKQSRLAHIQDQFAGIIELSVDEASKQAFLDALPFLYQSHQLQCQVSEAAGGEESGRLVTLECIGQDRPGIVFAISDLLHEANANVESMDTSYQNAPMAGEHLFCATFKGRLGGDVDLNALENQLSRIGQELMLDVQFEE